MPRLYPCNVRLVRLPRGGGSTVVLEEKSQNPDRKILSAKAHITQSIGTQQGGFVVDNIGQPYKWESGDTIKIEAKQPWIQSYTLLLDGIMGDPEYGLAGDDRPILSAQVVGWNSVLNLVSLPDVRTYTDTAFTTIASDLVTTFLSGFSADIESDAAIGNMTFQAGTSLREAFDRIRKVLIYKTGKRWEVLVNRGAGGKQVRLFKRDSGVQRTIKKADLLRSAKHHKGSFLEVMNRVIVIGANAPQATTDKTSLAATARYPLDAAAKRLAQPFQATDTPLYAAAFHADRSFTTDPPTLNGSIARNSDNVDKATGFVNASTDATSPANVNDGDDATAATVATTGGGVTKELVRFDMASPQAVAKWSYRHNNSGGADPLVTNKVQKSSDGATWVDLAILPSTGTIATDTGFIEDPDFRHVRIILIDNRIAASPSITQNAYTFKLFFQTTAYGEPLIGDELRASNLSWTVDDLINRPGLVNEKLYSTPNLALIVGRRYWLILEPAGGSSTSYWDVDYGTDATYGATAKRSTDSGATWTDVAANAVLRFILKFNNKAITYTANDVNSQGKYAGLLPNGVLAASLQDESLTTLEAVTAEAEGVLAVRKDVQPRIVVPIPFDPELEVGKRVTLADDVKEVLGISGDFDVVEVTHELTSEAKTFLLLNEHFLGSADALAVVAQAASQRRF